jgi:hypothetical protein
VSDLQRLAFGTIASLLVTSVFVLALFIGFCILFNLPKLKPRGPKARVVRNLDERLGDPPEYLPPTAPRGPADQLRTPELLEAERRKSA